MKKDLTELCCDDGMLGGLNLGTCPNVDFAIGLTGVQPLCYHNVSYCRIDICFRIKKVIRFFLFALRIAIPPRLHNTVPTVCDRPDQSAFSLHSFGSRFMSQS
jgi:hypothetical protein